MSKKTTYGQKRGRENTKQQPYVMFYYHVLDKPNYLALSGQARAALIMVCRKHNGKNNGEIVLSSKMAGELMGFNPRTAARALRELVQRGFLVITRESSFDQKNRARTYAITLFPYQGCQPTHLWKHRNSGKFTTGDCWRANPAKGRGAPALEVVSDEH